MEEVDGIAVFNWVLAGMMIMFILALGVIGFFLTYQRRLLKQQKEHQQKEADYQQQLLRANLKSQEKERNRIGKDLHDEVGALLTTSKLYFRHLDQSADKEKFDGLKRKVYDILDETIASVRRVSHDLRPVVLETLGLMEAVSGLTEKLVQSGHIDVKFSHQVQGKLEKEDALNWYRIIQELVNNTLKHANANLIEIDISGNRNGLRVTYKDNGVGLATNGKQSKGLGLSNIESRLNLMGGELEFKKSKGIHLVMKSNINGENQA